MSGNTRGIIALALVLVTGTALAGAHEGPDGAAVYEEHCDGCHGGGIGNFFSGAPTTGDAEEWEALMAKGADGLVQSTLAGVGKMKARGGCETCTDAEVRAAVLYMIEQLP